MFWNVKNSTKKTKWANKVGWSVIFNYYYIFFFLKFKIHCILIFLPLLGWRVSDIIESSTVALSSFKQYLVLRVHSLSSPAIHKESGHYSINKSYSLVMMVHHLQMLFLGWVLGCFYWLDFDVQCFVHCFVQCLV